MVIKRDFRTLAPATQAELRRVAVAMVRGGFRHLIVVEVKSPSDSWIDLLVPDKRPLLLARA